MEGSFYFEAFDRFGKKDLSAGRHEYPGLAIMFLQKHLYKPIPVQHALSSRQVGFQFYTVWTELVFFLYPPG